jgi:hypothetical protein
MLGRLLPFHSKQNPKKYRVQLIGFFSKNNLCILGVYNSVSKFKNHYFLAYQKKKNSFQVLAKIWREWPPHGSMIIKLNLLANGSICSVTCLALSWVS